MWKAAANYSWALLALQDMLVCCIHDNQLRLPSTVACQPPCMGFLGCADKLLKHARACRSSTATS